MSELTLRVLTAVVGVPLVLGAVYVGGAAAFALAWVAATAVAFEFAGIARGLWGAWWPLPSMAAGWLVLGGAWLDGVRGWATGVAGATLLLGAWGVMRAARRDPAPAVQAWAAGATYVLVAPAPYAFFILLRQIGRPHLLWPILVIWAADMAAYFIGRAWGRHRLAPRVSPGKSWEGLAAALAAGAAVGYGVARLAGWPPVALALASAGLVVAGTVGDLFESAFKRAAGRKDAGGLLPGHGGVWDRFDSLAFAMPVAWWLWQTWLP
ncbi:MAG: phosphatidate cytidylyltransferase [Clostridia bacterium]|nr:phosphatidate cytidylyltransferase [Clostridia bacterium]